MVTRRKIEENWFGVKIHFTKFRFTSLKAKQFLLNSNRLLLPNQHNKLMEIFVSTFAFDQLKNITDKLT